MQLYQRQPFWKTTVQRPTLAAPPAPARFYDAMIVGSGVSGLLTGLALAQSGLKLIIIDAGSAGAGSSCANTGLLQYASDITLTDLIAQIGEQQAVRFYRLCRSAVDALETTVRTLPASSDFFRRPSLYCASSLHDVKPLKKEYDTLLKYGFPVHYLEAAQVKTLFGFEKRGAILTDGDAEINPQKFCWAMIEQLSTRYAVDFFEHTALLGVKENGGSLSVQTTAGNFQTSAAIYATGYAPTFFLNNAQATINRTYAIATQPVAGLATYWRDLTLIWETARPYFYLRTTTDGRIIAGGYDERGDQLPTPAHIAVQTKRLLRGINQYFPDISVTAAAAWGAWFGESADNLPFIGRHPERHNLYCLLGYGGNGTVYSMIGAAILRDLIVNGKSADAAIVNPARA
ncbi:MAG: FAD-dependent oxidoreductase [Sporolactobacillus sp.]